MIRKISGFARALCIKVAGEVNSLKRDERGLSGVVVAILLILVAVLAIVLIWGFLSGWLGEIWDSITGQAEIIT